MSEIEMDTESRGRFKVSATYDPSTSDQQQSASTVGRFRLTQGGSPFLQRGRFSVIPEDTAEEDTASPHAKLGPKICIDPEQEPPWDFNVSF